jgi:predicted ATPase
VRCRVVSRAPLPGFHEEPFPSLAAEYEEKARGAFAARLQVLEGTGEADTLRSLARRAAMLFGDEERWFLSLMRAHRMADDFDAALRSYEALQRWARKNGEAASEEARALAKQLRRDKEKQAAQAPQALEEPEEEGAPLLEDISEEEVSALALNLPPQWTRFFGREAERELLGAWLHSGDRLITLSGPGGSGKTRLAVETLREAAPAWNTRVHFVPLASLSDPDLLFATIRDALGLTVGSDLPPLEQIERALKNQKCLLLLDNFEQLAERGAPLLQKLRERLPSATFLVTSRVLLRLPGEREFPVSPLPTPLPSTSAQEVESSPSAALFLDRAGIALDKANAEAIGALCRRLDGIPLALELAAARAKVLAPAQILERLSTHPDLLKSREMGVPDRHKTLRAAIEWSVDLLSPELRQFFARGCVFRGGWTLEAAEAICAPGVCEEWEAIDFLEALRDHSLLLTEEGPGGTRYRLLETLREWGQSQLQGEEKAELQRRHFEFYLAMAESAPDIVSLLQRGAELECEVPNFRAALGWALEQDDANLAARLAGALGPFWEARLHFSEGCDWMRRVLDRSGASVEGSIKARLWCAAGSLFWFGSNMARSQELLLEGVALYRDLDDEAGEAHALDMLGKAQCVRGEPQAGVVSGERAMEIARKRGDIARLASSTLTAAWGYLNSYQFPQAIALLDEDMALAEQIGQERLRVMCLVSKALCFSLAGDDEAAEAINARLIEGMASQDDPYARVFTSATVSVMACDSGRLDRARALLPESAHGLLSIGTRWEFANTIATAGEVAVKLGRFETAAVIFGATEAICERIGYILVGCVTRQYEAALEELQEKLDVTTLAEAWARGRRMSDEEAVVVTQELA